MPLKVIAPAEKTYTLTRSDTKYGDPKDPTIITIRQATQKEHEKRSTVFSEIIQEVNKDAESPDRYVMRYSLFVLAKVEVWLTLADCNINDTEGKPLFRFRDNRCIMTLEQFSESWGKLPPDVCGEIHEKIYELNPDWQIGANAEPLGE